MCAPFCFYHRAKYSELVWWFGGWEANSCTPLHKMPLQTGWSLSTTRSNWDFYLFPEPWNSFLRQANPLLTSQSCVGYQPTGNHFATLQESRQFMFSEGDQFSPLSCKCAVWVTLKITFRRCWKAANLRLEVVQSWWANCLGDIKTKISAQLLCGASFSFSGCQMLPLGQNLPGCQRKPVTPH